MTEEEKREKRREYCRLYYQKNRNRIRAQHREYYRFHKRGSYKEDHRSSITSGYSKALDKIVENQTADSCRKKGYTCLNCPFPKDCRW